MNLLGPATLGLITTIIFMIALRPLAFSSGLVDIPGGRKSHIGEVPITGGVAMFFGMLAGVSLVPDSVGSLWYMFLAGGILLVIGIVDDRQHVSVYVRLGAQAFAAIVMVYGGNLIIRDIGDPLGFGTIGLGSAAMIVTVLISVSVINAFNFIDGIDGLAGSLAAIAIAAIAIVAIDPATSITAVGVVACASIVGFLLFNFPVLMNRRVRSFMGDSGSTLLGLIVLWLTITVSQGESRPISPVIGLWFVLVPLADLFSCFVRRIAKGKSPLHPGREHLHHILLRGKLRVSQVLTLLTFLGAVYAGLGLLGNAYGVADSVMFAGWAVLMFVQYPLMKKIALVARSQCWKRIREAPVQTA